MRSSIATEPGPKLSTVRPISFLPALAIFVGFGFLARVFAYQVIPFLVDRGVHSFEAFLIAWTIPLAQRSLRPSTWCGERATR